MEWMLASLQQATAVVAQGLLALLGTPMSRQGDQLHHAGGFVAQVHLDCTAWWPTLGLLTVLALLGIRARAPWRRLAAGAVIGAGVMALANQLRLVAVLWAGVNAPATFDGVHLVIGPLMLVAAGAAVVVSTLGARRGAGALALGVALPFALPFALMPAGASTAVPPGAASSALAARVSQPAVSAAPSVGAASAAAPIVSGDLIVKFRDASEPGRALAAVLGGQRTVASVAPLAVRLSSELDLPLVLVQVTSGREALLALDRAALSRALLQRAGREPVVQRAATPGPATGPAAGLPASELNLRVELRRGTPAAAVDGLVQRLAIGGLTRPEAQRDVGGEAVRLRYDIDALTLALIARLQQRPDVEYAQANRLLRPASPPPPAASR